MKALSQTPRSEKQVPPRTLRGGDHVDVNPMRLRVETSEGVLLIYDAGETRSIGLLSQFEWARGRRTAGLRFWAMFSCTSQLANEFGMEVQP